MADQQPPASTEPKPSDVAPQAPGSQVPLPAVPGVFSPTTEKQVSDLLAEMQQYASTAAPGTTTTMQFSYQKSKHTTETSGQEPQVVESSHVEKAIHQTPPGGQPQPVEGPPPAQAAPAAQAPTGGILSHIPQFLQEKLGFGGPQQPAPQQPGQQVGQQVGQQIGQQVGQQHTEMSYHHTKKTTTTSSSSTTSGGEQQTITTQSQAPAASPAPPPPEPQPQPQPQQPQQQPQGEAPAPEGGFFAPLKAAAETIKEQVGHIPEVLQEKFGIGPHATEVQQQGGQSQTEISYQHTKKTTTTTSSSTSSGDQQQITSTAQHHEAPQPAPEEKPSLLEPLKDAAGKVVSGLEHMVEQAAKAFPHPPEGGNVHMEFSKHASRQVVSQSGAEPPQIETTSQGYTQVIQGIFDGQLINGGVVPVIVTKSITKSGSETDTTSQLSQASAPQVAAPPQQPQPSAPPSGTTTGTIDASSTSQLEEQLKKLGIQPGHPVTDLLQQTLAQHQRAKTPEANIEIQYSAQRTHSTRTVTYEASGADQKSAHEALQQLQTGLSTVAPPSETVPEPGPAESKPEVKPQESADQPPTQG